MHLIKGRNVHSLLPEALYALSHVGVREDSRNGPVLRFNGLSVLEYERPMERVLFHPERDANPFFHFFECLWMLNGDDDVPFLRKFSSNIKNYSDNGYTFHGAYGYRWRKWFDVDQLDIIIRQLKTDSRDRRCYLQMWDARRDLGKVGKDFPCNVGATFNIAKYGDVEVLDMVVHNRSNDLIWGALGANAVHFSFLQEYLATCLGLPTGRYWQVSSNLHAYEATYTPISQLVDLAADVYNGVIACPYQKGEVTPYPIMKVDRTIWMQDLAMFMKHGPIVGLREPFFRRVAGPMWHAYDAYRDKENPDRFAIAQEIMEQCHATDWKKACTEWLTRREANAKRAADDGVQK